MPEPLPRVLIIDDEWPFLDSLRHLLNDSGYEVLLASSGEEGLRLFRRESPDITLVDYMMPEIDGITVLQRIRSFSPDAEVIVITGHGELEIAVQAMRYGAADFLTKPAQIKTVRQTLQQAQERIHLKKQLRESQQALQEHAAELERSVKARTVELRQLSQQFARETNEHLQIKRLFRENEEKYKLLYEATGEAILMMTQQGDCFSANPAAMSLFGLSGEEDALSQSFASLSPPRQPEGLPSPQGAQQIIQRALAQGHHSFRWRFCRLDGHEFTADLLLSSMELEGQTILQLTARDITRQLELEARLQEYTEHLEALVEEKVRELEQERAKVIHAGKMATLGEMATGVAHELNQPLAAILFDTDYVKNFIRQARQRGETQLTFPLEEIEQICTNVTKDIERCRKIIDHLRAFGRLSSEEMLPVDLNTVIEQSFLLVRERLHQHNVLLQWSPAPALPPILADPNKLEQVLLNLLSNAEHALHQMEQWVQKGDVVRENYKKRLTIRTKATKDRVTVTVEDNGCGIPSALQERIFEPFFTTKPVGEGTGLGMSISYGIVAECGGEIELQSEELEGTTFLLSFPNAEAEPFEDKP